MKNSEIRVLMTGAGAPGGPGIIKALKESSRIQLWVADANSKASGRALHKDFIQIPNASHADFLPTILKLCKDHEIQVLLPLVTRELEILSGYKQALLEAGTKVIVSDFDSLSIANNKLSLMQAVQDAGIEVAPFFKANSAVEINKYAKMLGYPEKKVCIKPALANGSRGMRILDEASGTLEAFFNEKPGNTHLSLQTVMDVFGDSHLPDMLVMEYLPGAEYTVDALLENGEALVLLPRKRVAMNNGISVAGIFENHQEIIDYSKKIFMALKLDGPNGLQVKANEEGKYRILEINPRLQGSTTTAMGMGINLPLMSVLKASGEDISSHLISPRWGLSFARYYENAFF
jgi:carbamoyl-phosphate synthase large subunit